MPPWGVPLSFLMIFLKIPALRNSVIRHNIRLSLIPMLHSFYKNPMVYFVEELTNITFYDPVIPSVMNKDFYSFQRMIGSSFWSKPKAVFEELCFEYRL